MGFLGFFIAIALFVALLWGFFSALHRDPKPKLIPLKPKRRAASQDDTYESFYDTAEPRPVSANLRVKYRDAAGQITERDIAVRQFDSKNRDGLLLAHCNMRNATRSFRMDRFLGAVDLDTGEIIHSVHKHLGGIRAEGGHAALDQLYAAHPDVFKVLLYVGKADGRFTAAEKEAVAQFARQATGDTRITKAAIDELLGDLGVPTLNVFKLAVGRLASTPHAAAVLQAARNIVATQKTVSPGEQEALDYMAQRLEKSTAPTQNPQ